MLRHGASRNFLPEGFLKEGNSYWLHV